MEILITLSIVLMVLGILVLIRNHQVYEFRTKLLRKESEFCQRRIEEGKGFTSYNRYDSLPGYGKMMVHFWKPLSSYTKKPLEEYYD